MLRQVVSDARADRPTADGESDEGRHCVPLLAIISTPVIEPQIMEGNASQRCRDESVPPALEARGLSLGAMLLEYPAVFSRIGNFPGWGACKQVGRSLGRVERKAKQPVPRIQKGCCGEAGHRCNTMDRALRDLLPRKKTSSTTKRRNRNQATPYLRLEVKWEVRTCLYSMCPQ